MVQFSNPPKPTTRADVIALTRTWLGTPYVHQSSTFQVGCDCLGLLRGIWEGIYEQEAEQPPNYTPVWAELQVQGEEPMLDAARRHLIEKPYHEALPGDVFLVRIRRQSAIKHCGILMPEGKIVHAYDLHNVVEEPMRTNWKFRDLYAFSFPGVLD